jgi:hypothetical protein
MAEGGKPIDLELDVPVAAATLPGRLAAEESMVAVPSASSKRYQATLPPPAAPPGVVVSDWTSSAVSAWS